MLLDGLTITKTENIFSDAFTYGYFLYARTRMKNRLLLTDQEAHRNYPKSQNIVSYFVIVS